MNRNTDKSRIEITEQAYLIRLHKDDFDYVQVRAFLNGLMAVGSGLVDTVDQWAEEEDLRSRPAAEYGDRFDHLSDK